MSEIVECLVPGLDPKLGNPLKSFEDIMASFFKIIPNLISLDLPPKLLKQPLPQLIFDLFTSGLPKDFPAFEIPGFGKFDGKDIDPKHFDLGTPTTGLVVFITGLLTIQLGIPKIFIDFDEEGKPVPIPKLKLPPTDLKAVISELVKASLNLNLPEGSVPKDFPIKLVSCIVTSTLKTLS